MMTSVKVPIELRDRLKSLCIGSTPIYKVIEGLLNSDVEGDADVGRLEAIERQLDMLFEANVSMQAELDKLKQKPEDDIDDPF